MGVHADLTKIALFRTFVFVGDSLRANHKAFDLELAMLHQLRQDPTSKGHLALKVQCAMHQTCLIRKPAVLLIPHYWATLVRLSHLFETLSFRKQLATALTEVISSSFVHIQQMELPPDMILWQAQAERLKAVYWSNSRKRRDLLAECLEFCNGNLAETAVTHFCKFTASGEPCCENSQAALSKALKLLVPFFSAGFAPPLLYRFKYYSEAAGYALIRCHVHRLLVRALECIDSGSSESTSVSAELVGMLLGEMEQSVDDGELEHAVNDLLGAEHDTSFADSNAKRRQQVKAALSQPSFAQSAIIVGLVIQPMDGILNRFLRRSEEIAKLTLLGRSDPSWQEKAMKTKGLFLEYISGKLGMDLVAKYSHLLQGGFAGMLEIGLEPVPSNLQTFFTMVVLCITDTWRRFVHNFRSFPHRLFELLSECENCATDD